MLEFIASGSPQTVARAIEEYARSSGLVSAIVVPWESDASAISMSVTSVRADGWAIEHTNLGTIRLTGAGSDRTAVAAIPDLADHPEQGKLAALFDRFARQVQHRFGTDRAEVPAS